ncbi:tRNA guanosine(34) transglycosylase Tgt [[Eubacterium] cellulosolvens]
MFKIKNVCSSSRTGKLTTGHGEIQTPAFMPVATKGYVKTVTPNDLIELGTEVIIANSFLLYLRPGLDIIQESGGLHRFMNWSNPIFTDSGGFQMIRPDFHAKVDNRGITFRSPFDGDEHLFTPEKCLDTQVQLGIDVAMMLDNCPEYGSPNETIKTATEHTTAWGQRTISKLHELRTTHSQPLPQVFGIVQGGLEAKLRTWSAESLTALDFDGFGIGGLSIGEPKGSMYEMLNLQVPKLPPDKPRYLMGVGSPEDVLESIALGVDLFDSVFPTRNARHATIHTAHGNININRAPYSKQFSPLDEACTCETCSSGFSRAYINHLLKNYSILGMRLATIHNLFFIQQLLREARKHIKEGTFFEFKSEFLKNFQNKNRNG